MTKSLGSDGLWFPWTARGWIEEVLGDTELGAAILPLERGHIPNVRDALLHVIADRNGENAT
jgi:hypothetical protein